MKISKNPFMINFKVIKYNNILLIKNEILYYFWKQNIHDLYKSTIPILNLKIPF